MNFTPEEFEVFRLKPNDILLNEGQSLELVGRPALYRDELPGACFANTLVRFRPCPSLDVKFALSVYGDYVEQLTFLLFLKMADEQTKPRFNQTSPILYDFRSNVNHVRIY